MCVFQPSFMPKLLLVRKQKAYLLMLSSSKAFIKL